MTPTRTWSTEVPEPPAPAPRAPVQNEHVTSIAWEAVILGAVPEPEPLPPAAEAAPSPPLPPPSPRVAIDGASTSRVPGGDDEEQVSPVPELNQESEEEAEHQEEPAAQPAAEEADLEARVNALKGQALKDELKRVFNTSTGGEKTVALQRAKLLEAYRHEQAGTRIPGQWVDEEMENPDPQFKNHPPFAKQGPHGDAATLKDDDSATPLQFFLLFFTEAMIGAPPSR